MKLTKARLQKIWATNKQTKKKFNNLKNKKSLKHTNTYRKNRSFNLKNKTFRKY